MAAAETPPGSSCSHALRDYQDPRPPHPGKGRPSWGPRVGIGGKKKGWSLQSPGGEGP